MHNKKNQDLFEIFDILAQAKKQDEAPADPIAIMANTMQRMSDELTETIKDLESTENWEFRISHPSIMDLDELAGTLSRKTPMLYTQNKQRFNSNIEVVIHHSIITKAKALGLQDTVPDSLDIYEGYAHASLGGSAEIKYWTQWVQHIIAAEWKHPEPCTIMVQYPI